MTGAEEVKGTGERSGAIASETKGRRRVALMVGNGSCAAGHKAIMRWFARCDRLTNQRVQAEV